MEGLVAGAGAGIRARLMLDRSRCAPNQTALWPQSVWLNNGGGRRNAVQNPHRSLKSRGRFGSNSSGLGANGRPLGSNRPLSLSSMELKM